MPLFSGRSFGEEKGAARIRVLEAVFALIFISYAARLFGMQILNGELYQNRAQDIARRTTVIAARRGEIYDRNFDTPLVSNTDSFAVSITPAEIPRGEIDAVIDRLAQLLRLSPEQIAARIPANAYSLYQAVEIASNLSFAGVSAIAENIDALPGVSWQPKPARNYAGLGSLSHVTGYVGNITQDELTMMYNQGYQQGDIIGKAGIERQYDELLRGRKGRETRAVDVRGRRIAGDANYVREAPEMGKNLVLTIDRSVQVLAEQALGKRMGAVVVMRPASGEILALVSYPWYDPNIFSRGDLASEYQAVIDDPNKPLLNRAIQSNYPPASVFKIVMSTGILAEGVFPPEQLIDCQGELSYGERAWHCHIRRPGHGRLNLQRAMAQSCDIYYWIVGRDHLGVERIVNYAREFGFGELTGIDLPGEISGIVPTPQWKERRIHERWLGGDTMNMSIGQGYTLVTPIQMANMVSMVVNDGLIFQPHLLREVRDPRSGAVERSAARRLLHRSEVDPEVFARVRRDMRSVISEGTARFPLSIRSVEIAGKTGTGEVGLQNHWHSWFAAFAPYRTDKPEERVVVSIIVEAVNDWEWWAPYASAIIFQGIFAHESYEDAVRSLGLEYIAPVQVRRE
ncbi:MAG: penicillin-binding protein 2 [Spirochaetaceae bacterium]|jgi:penicillin-binding protein 2|nr:penicillin-binding protein 2 [Spirochaetaceae bacterium]